MSYIVTDPFDTIIGGPLGCVTDALTGVAVAHYANGWKIPLGVLLCDHCDAPVDGFCANCEEDA